MIDSIDTIYGTDNYYSNKYNELVEKKFSVQDAFTEICHIYLDDKPRKYMAKELIHQDRNEMFWVHNVWHILPKELFNTELFAVVLNKNFLNSSLQNVSLIMTCAEMYPAVFIRAVKSSKIFIENDSSFALLKNELKNESSLKDFFIVCDILAKKYIKLNDGVILYRRVLNSYGYLDLLCLISLYMMKNIEENTKNIYLFEHNGRVFSKILQDRLEEVDRKKRAMNEYYVQEKLAKYFISPNKVENFEEFEQLVNAYMELIAFEQGKLSTFCYDENYTVSLEKEYVHLIPLDIEKAITWHLDGHKIIASNNYYIEEARGYVEQEYKDSRFGSLENEELNKSIFIWASSNVILLADLYGVDTNIHLDNQTIIQTLTAVHGLSSLIGLYGKEFVNTYLDFKKGYTNFWEAKYYFIGKGMFSGTNRLPLIHTHIDSFAEILNSQHRVTNGSDIEKFWTNDLRDINKTKKKIPNLFEKPLLKIDDFVFKIPWVLALQHPTTTFLNSLLRVHHNRSDRKNEVHSSEKFIHNLFKDNGFIVESSFDLPGHENKDVGDIDVICFKDGCLFVLELKSTYIRTSMQEAWVYKTKVLRKAGHQLHKRVKAIESLLEGNNAFTEKFGKPDNIYSWVVDTSFDFDHEYFEGSLKVSMFEIIYALNSENEDFYPEGFNVNKFVEIVESQRTWTEILERPELLVEDMIYKLSIKESENYE